MKTTGKQIVKRTDFYGEYTGKTPEERESYFGGTGKSGEKNKNAFPHGQV